jgi:hypothetical protein
MIDNTIKTLCTEIRKNSPIFSTLICNVFSIDDVTELLAAMQVNTNITRHNIKIRYTPLYSEDIPGIIALIENKMIENLTVRIRHASRILFFNDTDIPTEEITAGIQSLHL